MMTLIDTLGLTIPLVQAPMAGVSTPMMAAAVSEAGGLGGIAIGASDVAAARAMIAETKARTRRPFNVNVFCHRPAIADPAREAAWLAWLAPRFAEVGAAPPFELREIYTSFVADPAMLAMLIEERPRVVSFHFGLPSAAAIAALRAAGILLFATATGPAEARTIVAAGIDAIVAQGIEAGGHRGTFDPDAADDALGTVALTRLLVRQTHVPVIAAGGMMDGAGIAAALRLGAVAAQLGTAFVATPESAADAGYRAALFGPAARHTRMTRLVSGRAARSLASHFTAMDSAGAPVPPDYPIAYDAAKSLHAAAKARGDHGYGALWAGQGAPLARALPAGDLVAMLRAELASALG